MALSRAQLHRLIDHTILKPEATEGDVRRVVAEAVAHRFASVCVNGLWVGLVSDLLHQAGAGDEVLTCAVVGFPLGAMKGSVKAVETSVAVKDGAREIDMVVSLGLLLDGRFEAVRQEIFDVVKTARAAWGGTVVKVILETAALDEERIALGCRAATEAGADFVKTSTGFHPRGGATAEAVRLLKKYAPALKVKASGGIRDLAAAEAMIAAGADRLGCSASVAIVDSVGR